MVRKSDVYRLLEVEEVTKRKGSTKALVPLARAVCPACGKRTVTREAFEDALFFHGGYGASRYTRGVQCEDNDCGWYVTAEVSETRPPRLTVTQTGRSRHLRSISCRSVTPAREHKPG